MDEEMLQGTETEETAQEESTEVAAGTDDSLDSGSVALDENGGLKFSDDFFDPEFGPRAEEPVEDAAEGETEVAEAEPAPVYYTPQEFAAAVMAGSVDESKVKPDALEFYKATMQNIEASRQARPQQAPPVPVQPLPEPQIDFKQLREMSKRVAAERLLGIKAEDFDEYNAEHSQAMQYAMTELRERAMNLYRQDAARHMQAQQAVAQRDRIMSDYQKAYDDFGRENPDIDMNALNNGFSEWLSGLTVKDATEVQAAMRSGDVGKARMIMSRMANDFRKAKGAGAGGQARVAKAAVKAPPKVEGSGGGVAKDEAGVIDISKLGEMSASEQADLLLKLKIV